MSVPLDNLYHWIEGMLPAPAVIYLFYPHGSKNISDFNLLKAYDLCDLCRFPAIIVHDQEPLDWNLYNCSEDYSELNRCKGKQHGVEPSEFVKLSNKYYINFNLNSRVFAHSSWVYDNSILIHSEKNSVDLAQYQQNGFIPVHYWAHAVIARDWYRFAQFDSRLNCKTPQFKFLIYCRDWSHQREYRLKFLELLAKNQLDQHSQTSVMHTNSEGIHFSQYQFRNSAFELENPELISQIPANTFSSTASADYNYQDFVSTEISVVLETIFDDSRIHLTEKTLKPIACGHPFILAAGPGALEYVKSYGFKTFAPWIDESYDLETDSFKRMQKIQQAMIQIKNLKGFELEKFTTSIRSIAEFNKKHFFSEEFFNNVKLELQNNLEHACEQVKKTKGNVYMSFIKLLKSQQLISDLPDRRKKTLLLRQLRQSCQDSQSKSQVDPSV